MIRAPSFNDTDSLFTQENSQVALRRSPEPGARFTAIGVDDDMVATSNFKKYFNTKLKAASIPFTVKVVSTFAEGERLIEDLTFINFAVVDFNLDKGKKGGLLQLRHFQSVG